MPNGGKLACNRSTRVQVLRSACAACAVGFACFECFSVAPRTQTLRAACVREQAMCRGRGRGRFLPSFFSLSNGALSPDNTLRSRSPLNLAPDTGAQPARSPRPEPPSGAPASTSRQLLPPLTTLALGRRSALRWRMCLPPLPLILPQTAGPQPSVHKHSNWQCPRCPHLPTSDTQPFSPPCVTRHLHHRCTLT